jgi:hypothetical protein
VCVLLCILTFCVYFYSLSFTLYNIKTSLFLIVLGFKQHTIKIKKRFFSNLQQQNNKKQQHNITSRCCPLHSILPSFQPTKQYGY